MINVGLRDVKSNSDALAFKLPFYSLAWSFHGVFSHATATAKLYLHSSLQFLDESKFCLMPPAPCAKSRSWDLFFTSSSIPIKIQYLVRFLENKIQRSDVSQAVWLWWCVWVRRFSPPLQFRLKHSGIKDSSTSSLMTLFCSHLYLLTNITPLKNTAWIRPWNVCLYH